MKENYSSEHYIQLSFKHFCKSKLISNVTFKSMTGPTDAGQSPGMNGLNNFMAPIPLEPLGAWKLMN